MLHFGRDTRPDTSVDLLIEGGRGREDRRARVQGEHAYNLHIKRCAMSAGKNC